jgi:glycerol-3-phosphate dehydrogenase (NAD(P)+)
MADCKSALSVIGAGSYGTSLAVSVASKGLQVTLWDRKSERVLQMQKERENRFYLPEIKFPESLKLTSSLKTALEDATTILLVVPSHTFKGILEQIVPYLTPKHRLAWATKGLDKDSGDFLSNTAKAVLPFPVPMAALSGPTFARELALGMPTAIAVAGDDQNFISDLCNLMHTPTFRVYECADFIGLQLGGAIKNVIAIAAGLSDGLGYGANARTALVTRGLAEMIRLGVALGATERGFMGLSGLGDLILTCTDNQSRNRRFGVMLGQGLPAHEALEKIGQVVEGYTMTATVHKLISHMDLQMPICTELYEVLYNGKSGPQAARDLLSRSLKSE